MSHSLNEIEAMSKRAARGAGMSWGMSEEAAKASRWLASHDLPGPAMLADVLTQNDQRPYREVAPVSLDGIWHARSGTLCPLSAGATLNDCAERLSTGQPIEMKTVSHPLLVVPFAAWASIHIGAPVAVSWLRTCISTDGNRVWIEDPEGEVKTTAAPLLTCTLATSSKGRAAAPALRGNVSQSDWAHLSRFAHRTYAPATPESRRLGAGAGVTDND